MKKYYRVLSIAASDCSGGAGIQADLKTFEALDCYGMTAITALTAQNTLGVHSIYSVSPECLREQIAAVINDIGVDAIKIGMLHRAEIIHVVADCLQDVKCPIVLDPVMIAKGGQALLSSDAISVLSEKLFPLVTLITPNIPEAACLTTIKINNSDDMKRAAMALHQRGAKNVLIKGGHLDSTYCIDILYTKNRAIALKEKRIITKNTHGTGCTLSAAIAAELAKGNELVRAVRAAKQFLTRAIKSGNHYICGAGSGPVKWGN